MHALAEALHHVVRRGPATQEPAQLAMHQITGERRDREPQDDRQDSLNPGQQEAGDADYGEDAAEDQHDQPHAPVERWQDRPVGGASMEPGAQSFLPGDVVPAVHA